MFATQCRGPARVTNLALGALNDELTINRIALDCPRVLIFVVWRLTDVFPIVQRWIWSVPFAAFRSSGERFRIALVPPALSWLDPALFDRARVREQPSYRCTHRDTGQSGRSPRLWEVGR